MALSPTRIRSLIRKTLFIVSICALSFQGLAKGVHTSHHHSSPQLGFATAAAHPWYFTGSLGYTVYEKQFRDDGQTPVWRFAIGRALYATKRFLLGLEAGVQNGNTMRLADPVANDSSGDPTDLGVILSTVKPMLDLLAVMKIRPIIDSRFFIVLKGGAAYRRWHFDNRTNINDLSQLAGEVQAGLGCQINKRSSLSLTYQGIFGGNPNLQTVVGFLLGVPFAISHHVSNIPVQQGVLLNLTVSV